MLSTESNAVSVSPSSMSELTLCHVSAKISALLVVDFSTDIREADKEDKEAAVDQIAIFVLFHGFVPVRGDEFKAFKFTSEMKE